MKKTNSDDLVLENINLIYYVLKQYGLYHQLETYYDLCMIGLVKAANNFDESKGYNFSTYGISCIRSELFGYLRRENNSKRKANYNTISLDTVRCENKGKALTLLDILPSDINIEEELIQKEEIEELYKALDILDKREYIIISYMYGINGYNKINQFEIAKKIGVQQATVSRIGKKAIRKMRYYLRINRGVDYE